MKKILYVIPIILLMILTFNLKVNAFDYINHRPKTGDLFNVIYIDNENEIAYLGLVSSYEQNAIIYMATDYEYEEIISIGDVGAYVSYNEGYGGFLPDYSPLQENNEVWYISHDKLSNGITTIKVYSEDTNNYYIFNGENLPVGMPTYKINKNGLPVVVNFNQEWYEYAVNKGKQEMQEYYENLLPNLLHEEFLRGKNEGIQEAYENISEDLPEWIKKANYKVNNELYNFIDYENLIFYENVGQVVFNGNENWLTNYNYNETIQFYVGQVYLDNHANLNITNIKAISGTYKWNIKTWNDALLDKDKETFWVYENTSIGVLIKKSRLIPYGYNDNLSSTDKLNIFKQYLSQNTITVTYELAEKQEYIVPEVEISQLPFYNYGLSDGYSKGYTDGTKDSNAIKGFIPSIIGSIWIVVANFLSFEIFGISLWWILGIIVAISLAIFVIKMVI